MKKAVSCAGLALIGAWFASPAAQAYVPPSGFIVKTMAAKHTGPKGVRVRSLVSSFDASNPARFRITSVFVADAGLIRSWVFDESGQQLYGGERKVASGGAPASVTALLFDSRLGRVQESLRKLGIPLRTEEELLALKDEEERRSIEVSSLGRWKKSIAWVLGGKDTKADAQLWVEKDTFLPIRLLTELQDSDGPREAQFENFRFYSEFPFPRLITWVVKNQALFREELVDFLVNPPELKTLHQPFTPGYTEAGNAAPSAVRDLISGYFEALR